MSKSSDSKNSHPNIQSVVNRLPIIIAYLDKDFRYRVANETYREWFGWDPEEMIGKTVMEMVGPEAAKLVIPQYERVLKGERIEFRSELPYPNGKRYVKANYDPDFDENGNVVGIFATVSDITEQMKARSALEASEASYRMIFNATNVGISAMNVQTGKWFETNAKFQDLTGYTNEELINMTPNEITHPDDVVTDDELRNRFFRDEIPVYRAEKRYIHKSGRVLWVRIDSTIIARDADGKPLRSLGTVQDITAEKASIEALREREAYFREVVDSSPAMIWIMDRDSKCIYLSKKWYEYTGRTPEQDLGFGWLENIHPEDLPGTEAVYTKAVESKGFLGVDYRLRSKDGTYRWMIDTGSPRVDENGEFLGYIGNVTDIHDRVRAVTDLRNANVDLVNARDEAERANKLKSAFLANMSHEIRTPLNAILGFADLLRDSKLTDMERNNFLNIINRNGDQLSVIINDILDLSKVEAGHLVLEHTTVDPRRLAQDVVSLLELQAKEKNLRLEVQIEDTAPAQTTADPIRVKQILVNLVGNAIKFTHTGSIDLKVSGENDNVVFTVTDTGIGIPAEQIDKIFELFVQGDGSMTRRFGGTGLGLTLSRSLARSMGGDIKILSSETGKGSTFQVTIKSQNATTTAEPVLKRNRVHTQVETELSLSGKHILVVDDSRDNQQLMMRTLVKRGAQVDLASDGQDALDKASFDKHDLILMDIQMPVMDGYTATQKLRDRGFSKPIIALTAHAMSEVRKKVLSVGCTDHLSKPINASELVRVILEHS